jgi:hypothetical protein
MGTIIETRGRSTASTTRIRSWTAAMLVAVFVGSACSGGRGAMPTPTPTPANVAGTWRGTVGFTAGGVAGEELFEMTLLQASGSAAVTGSYAAAARFTGNITGQTTETSFSGTFGFNSNVQGQICTGTFNVSGPAGGNTLTWTSPSIIDAPCTNTPINLVIEVQRQ